MNRTTLLTILTGAYVDVSTGNTDVTRYLAIGICALWALVALADPALAMRPIN